MPQSNVLSMWLTAWVLWCGVALPQSKVALPENTGRLQVEIGERNGRPISVLTVTISGSNVDRIVPSTRPPIRFESLPFGTYELKVVAEHFLPFSTKVVIADKGWTMAAVELTLDEASVVAGEVSEVKHSVLPGATVTLSAPGARERRMVTDLGGRFRFQEVSHGRYELKVELETFKTVVRTIVVGKKPLGSLRLVLDVDPVRKPVTVVGF